MREKKKRKKSNGQHTTDPVKRNIMNYAELFVHVSHRIYIYEQRQQCLRVWCDLVKSDETENRILTTN